MIFRFLRLTCQPVYTGNPDIELPALTQRIVPSSGNHYL